LKIKTTFPFGILIQKNILTLLTAKYQVVYRDIDRLATIAKTKKNGKRKSTVKFPKIKATDMKEEKERHRDEEKLFYDFTGRFLSSQQVSNETSAQT
jgi:hypothetical protein